MNNRYHFITRWRFEASPERAFELIRKPLEFPRWWGTVYLKVEQIDPGDKDDVGAKVRSIPRAGCLIGCDGIQRLQLAARPSNLALRATGDFEGRGVWTLQRDGRFTNLTFDWELTAEKPLLRYLSFLLRPLFEWNHRWATEQGRIGFEEELKRADDAPA